VDPVRSNEILKQVRDYLGALETAEGPSASISAEGC
jgi:hypothetical protein